MKLSIIGMSGSGKTYWSKKLEGIGFKRYCVDNLIEEKLADELKILGYSGIKDVALWMGQPFDKQYGETSKKYLNFEKEVMEDIFSSIDSSSKGDIVIDTTGSVIYHNRRILAKLKVLTRVIYLKVPAGVEHRMYKLYISDPKPVIWGRSFSKKRNEENLKALKRCYPKLLEFRANNYQKLSHVTLDYHQVRDKAFNAQSFLKQIS